MRTRSFPRILLLLGPALALACHAPDLTDPAAVGNDQTPVLTPQLPAGVADLPPFDPNTFVPAVTNPLFPLPLGRRLIYRGTEDDMPETVVTDITRGQKTILGVAVTVVLDRVFLNGELKEKTFDWYAQDTAGNVWYFGEDTKEYENGKVVSTAGSFEAGKNGAKAGIIMRAHPKVGQVTPQEFAPGIAEDKARVLDLNAMITVPYGTFTHCLKQEEFTPLEPEALENKYYCPGVGIVKELDVKGGTVNTGLTTIINY
ncbi:MAG TPA: hypothetical protein VFU03_01990 [Gemmatimonadales bacterium]|nr:hypothetical protein [Gemmatimonadales bacterium]